MRDENDNDAEITTMMMMTGVIVIMMRSIATYRVVMMMTTKGTDTLTTGTRYYAWSALIDDLLGYFTTVTYV